MSTFVGSSSFEGEKAKIFGFMLAASILTSASPSLAITAGDPLDPFGLNQIDLGSSRPFVWTEAEGFIGLGRLPDGMTVELENSVGADGTVVGTASNARRSVAFTWDRGEGVTLLDVELGANSGASAIDDQGLILGWQNSASAQQAVIWKEGKPQPISQMSELPDNVSLVEALGSWSTGEIFVLVQVQGADEPQVAIWKKEEPLEFLSEIDGLIPTSLSDVSPTGYVVGKLSDANTSRAFLWHPSEGGRTLSSLNGYDVQVLGVNSAGEAVGAELSESMRALLWSADGTPFDLNDAIIDHASQSITLVRADSINDAGEIVAYGLAPDNSVHLVKLLPAEASEDEGEGEDALPRRAQFRLQDLGQVYLRQEDQPLASLHLSNSGAIVGSCEPLARVCQMPGADLFVLDPGITNFFQLGRGDAYVPLLSDSFSTDNALGGAIGNLALAGGAGAGAGAGTNSSLFTTPQGGGAGSTGLAPFSSGFGFGGGGTQAENPGVTSLSPVPLPGGAGLLLSALVFLVGARRKPQLNQ